MIIEPIKPRYKNKYAVCFASDDNYARHLAVALESVILKSNEKFQYDVIILDNGIAQNNINVISTLATNCKNFSIRFVTCKNLMPQGLNDRKNVSVTAYARLLAPDVLKLYKKVVYLDCDLVVNNDIANLFSIDLDNNYIGGVRSFIYNAWCYENSAYGKKCKKYLKEKIELDDVFNFINSGVLIFDISRLIKDGFTSDKLFKVASSRLWSGLDEDVINYVFKKHIKLIDPRWNVMIAEKFNYEKIRIKLLPNYLQSEYICAHKNPYILHYVGRKQPIYNENVEYEDLYWDIAKNTPFYDLLKNEELNFKKSFKFRANNFKIFLAPRNSKRWAFAKKVLRSTGPIKFYL